MLEEEGRLVLLEHADHGGQESKTGLRKFVHIKSCWLKLELYCGNGESQFFQQRCSMISAYFV